MTRFFMTIPEASQLVIQAGAMGKGGEIFVLDMGQPVRIVTLAEDMIRLSGFKAYEDIEIEFIGLRPGEKLRQSRISSAMQSRGMKDDAEQPSRFTKTAKSTHGHCNPNCSLKRMPVKMANRAQGP